MARGVNKVIIVGNLGADPEIRYTGSGAAICSLRVATSESWLDKQSGQKQERTEWHRITVFGKLAEICKEYLHKGRQVYIEGSLRTSKYQGKDGTDRYSTDIVARDMQMLGGQGGESASAPAGGGYSRAPAPSQAPAPSGSAPIPQGPMDGGFDDDDIPF